MVEHGWDGAAERSTRERMLDDLMQGLRVGGRGLKSTALGGVRTLMPLIEAYAARRAQDGDGADEPGAIGLKRGEEEVLKTAGEKVFLELLEITTRTHPAYEGAPPFDRKDAEGRAQTPHLRHLLALAAAAAQYFGGDKDDGDEGEPPAPPPTPAPQGVVYMAVAPGEYEVVPGPITPREMRRNAMRQRSYTPPPAAVLKSAANARHAEIGPASAPMAAGKGGSRALPQRCGCGALSSACGCGGGARTFSPARYDEDGDCASTGSISCETRWRVRECFKWAFCDLLRCLGDELCDDGKFAAHPDMGACLESFVCSIVTCLPDAICPPPEKACEESTC
jgi:hypothetical protein